MPSGGMVIFVELSVLHWHFDSMLNASMMTARAAMRVYMFHGHQFYAPVMSQFFCPHETCKDITLDDVRPLFHPPMHPTNREFNSDTHLTPTYFMESNPSEPSYPSMILLTSDSFSSASQALRLGHVRRFIRIEAISRGHAWALGGGRGDDTLGGLENGFVPFCGWFRISHAELGHKDSPFLL